MGCKSIQILYMYIDNCSILDLYTTNNLGFEMLIVKWITNLFKFGIQFLLYLHWQLQRFGFSHHLQCLLDQLLVCGMLVLFLVAYGSTHPSIAFF